MSASRRPGLRRRSARLHPRRDAGRRVEHRRRQVDRGNAGGAGRRVGGSGAVVSARSAGCGDDRRRGRRRDRVRPACVGVDEVRAASCVAARRSAVGGRRGCSSVDGSSACWQLGRDSSSTFASRFFGSNASARARTSITAARHVERRERVAHVLVGVAALLVAGVDVLVGEDRACPTACTSRRTRASRCRSPARPADRRAARARPSSASTSRASGPRRSRCPRRAGRVSSVSALHFAMPKSASLGSLLPPTVPNRMFCGLISRCTMPSPCASASAAHIADDHAHRLDERLLALLADDVRERAAVHVLAHLERHAGGSPSGRGDRSRRCAACSDASGATARTLPGRSARSSCDRRRTRHRARRTP